MEEYRRKAREQLVFIPYASVLFISAKYGQRVQQALEAALKVVEERQKRISTSVLNKILRSAVAKHPPPSKPGKWIKFYYATQVNVSPPTFVFFCNDPAQLHFSYRRYLENELRATCGFDGTPIRMSFRGREEGV
jgi:GTP-binding protein